jgi:flagellar protein FliO/FliZ
MQALVERISENRSLTFLAWAIALLLAAALILFIFRLAFGRRLKTPAGGRARMPRLGVVDAFDLDRHRQLVIVRRDNVEHLLMIGGPNDLVIESEIMRAEGREVRLRDNAREKEAREALQAPAPAASPAQTPIAPPSAPPSAPWQPELEPALARASQPPRKTPAAPIPPVVPPLAPAAPTPAPSLAAPADAEPPAPVLEEPVAQLPGAPPAPRAPAFPPPPRRVAQPLAAGRAPREPSSRPDFASRIEPAAGSAGGFQRAPLATPFLRTSPRQPADPKSATASSSGAARSFAGGTGAPSRHDGEAAVPPVEGATPDAASAPPAGASAPAPETASPASGDAPAPSQAPPIAPAADKFADEANLSIDSLDQSLEEEMARLLGRGT